MINLKNIPNEPWVYIYYDKNKKIIYIWKSLNLKSRVSSYFNSKSKLNFAKKKMVENIANIETIITNNEVESLLLETNLIKKHKPKYNILMKDDKSHTYIKITNDIIPKIIKTRIKNKSWTYFWPYTSTTHVNNLLKITKKLFWYRSCNIIFDKKEDNIFIKSNNWSKIPCIDYYIKRCSWPCLLSNEKINEYLVSIENIKNFLWGDYKKVIKKLEEQMKEYASKLDFEKAQSIKKDIESIMTLDQNQIISNNIKNDTDVINYLEKYWKIFLSLIQVRSSKITWIYNYEIQNKVSDINETVEFFIENNYLNNTNKIDLILPKEINISQTILEKLNIKIEIPKIWEKQELLKMAYKNAFEYWYKKHLESLSVKWFTKKDMIDLLEILDYKKINKNIIFECNDISHISWNYTVASRSVMENWKMNNKKYRKYKIKTLKKWEIDDFKSMNEVFNRRLDEIIKTKNIPDLIIIDGWKWQLSSVVNILENKKLDTKYKEYIEILNKIQLVSIAKKQEELFLPNKKEPILIKKDSNTLRMIQKIRDEAHRFAITFNRDKRNKQSKVNILESLPWIWPKTRIKLLKHYGSVENIKNDEKLRSILNKNQIETLIDHAII